MTPFEELLASNKGDLAAMLRALCRSPKHYPTMVVVDEITAAARKVLELYQAYVAVTQCGSSEVTMVLFPTGTELGFQPDKGALVVMPGEAHVLVRCANEGRTVLRVLSPPELEQAK